MLTEQQLFLRKSGLGGSDVAAALGKSPWVSPLELWQDKVSDEIEEKHSDAMEWGSRLERAILQKFRESHPEALVSESTMTVRHNQLPYLLATPDGLISADAGSGIVEVKTASGQQWEKVPEHYMLQLQHYLFVTGRTYGYFAVLFNGREYREYGPFEADPVYGTEVVPELDKFWQKVEKADPEGISPETLSELEIIQPLGDSDIEASNHMLDLVADIKLEELLCKQSQERLKELKLKLGEQMGESKRLLSDGNVLVTQSQIADSVIFDSTKFKKEHADLFEAYRTKSRKGYRRMVIK